MQSASLFFVPGFILFVLFGVPAGRALLRNTLLKKIQMNHTDITPHIIPRRQWLVAYVQSCLEKKTAERLKAMGVEYYLPIQSEIRQWSDRRKKVDRLVIPMMIFVHVTPQERPLPLTLQAISRYMVLRGESRPAVIPEEQMERFRFMLDYSPEAVEICSTPPVSYTHLTLPTT